MLPTEKSIKLLELNNGTIPFKEWLETLDRTLCARVMRRVGRLRLGNLGDWKACGDGVFELRLDFGPGYRVYYAACGEEVIILLGGGEKKGQTRDIRKIQKLWEELKNETARFQEDFK